MHDNLSSPGGPGGPEGDGGGVAAAFKPKLELGKMPEVNVDVSDVEPELEPEDQLIEDLSGRDFEEEIRELAAVEEPVPDEIGPEPAPLAPAVESGTAWDRALAQQKSGEATQNIDTNQQFLRSTAGGEPASAGPSGLPGAESDGPAQLSSETYNNTSQPDLDRMWIKANENALANPNDERAQAQFRALDAQQTERRNGMSDPAAQEAAADASQPDAQDAVGTQGTAASIEAPNPQLVRLAELQRMNIAGELKAGSKDAQELAVLSDTHGTEIRREDGSLRNAPEAQAALGAAATPAQLEGPQTGVGTAVVPVGETGLTAAGSTQETDTPEAQAALGAAGQQGQLEAPTASVGTAVVPAGETSVTAAGSANAENIPRYEPAGNDIVLQREIDAANAYAGIGQEPKAAKESVIIDQEPDQGPSQQSPASEGDPNTVGTAVVPAAETGIATTEPAKTDDDIIEGEYRELPDDEDAGQPADEVGAAAPTPDSTEHPLDKVAPFDASTLAVEDLNDQQTQSEHDRLSALTTRTPEEDARLAAIEASWDARFAKDITMSSEEMDAAMIAASKENAGGSSEPTTEPPPAAETPPLADPAKEAKRKELAAKALAGTATKAERAELNKLNAEGNSGEELKKLRDRIANGETLSEAELAKLDSLEQAQNPDAELTAEQLEKAAKERDEAIENAGVEIMMKMSRGEMPTKEELDELQKLLAEKDMIGKGFTPEIAREAIKNAQEKQRGSKKGTKDTEEAKKGTMELMGLQYELLQTKIRMEGLRDAKNKAIDIARKSHDAAEIATPEERAKKKAVEYNDYMKVLNIQATIEGQAYAAQEINARTKDLEQFVRRKSGVTGGMQAVWEWGGAKLNNTMTAIAKIAEEHVPLGLGSAGGAYQRRQLAGSGRA